MFANTTSSGKPSLLATGSGGATKKKNQRKKDYDEEEEEDGWKPPPPPKPRGFCEGKFLGGISAEEWVKHLKTTPDVQDRTYHLKNMTAEERAVVVAAMSGGGMGAAMAAHGQKSRADWAKVLLRPRAAGDRHGGLVADDGRVLGDEHDGVRAGDAELLRACGR